MISFAEFRSGDGNEVSETANNQQLRAATVRRDSFVNLFTVGVIVTLRIPRADRYSVHNRCLICKVISKSPRRQRYGLQKEVGVLEKWLSTDGIE